MSFADRLVFASLAAVTLVTLSLSPRDPWEHDADIWVRDYALRFFATLPHQPGIATQPERIERLASGSYALTFQGLADDPGAQQRTARFQIRLAIAEHGQPARKDNPRGYAVTNFAIERLER